MGMGFCLTVTAQTSYHVTRGLTMIDVEKDRGENNYYRLKTSL